MPSAVKNSSGSDSMFRESIDSNKRNKFTNYVPMQTENTSSMQKFSSHAVLYPHSKTMHKTGSSGFGVIEDEEIPEEIKMRETNKGEKMHDRKESEIVDEIEESIR